VLIFAGVVVAMMGRAPMIGTPTEPGVEVRE
jgi:hypothetical protein